MPQRWWVPLPHIDPRRVAVSHVHAAVSGWFDQSLAEHNSNDKPYSLTPISRAAGGEVGIEVGVLTTYAEQCLQHGVAQPTGIRLGSQLSPVGTPRLIHAESWAGLATPTEARAWQLELLTPTTFRSGDRASPLPSVRTILEGLHRAWTTWADPALAPPNLRVAVDQAWVSDLQLTSEVLELPISRRRGDVRGQAVVSGCRGTLTLRASNIDAAQALSPLVRLAAYTGVGGMTRRGLGVTRVRPLPSTAHGRTG